MLRPHCVSRHTAVPAPHYRPLVRRGWPSRARPWAIERAILRFETTRELETTSFGGQCPLPSKNRSTVCCHPGRLRPNFVPAEPPGTKDHLQPDGNPKNVGLNLYA